MAALVENTISMARSHLRLALLPSWLLSGVVLPFAISRVALVLVAWFAQLFTAGSIYPEALRGVYTQHFWLDIWLRWDTGWYLSIVEGGYRVADAASDGATNFAFFPLYPYTVKALSWLLPPSLRSTENILLIGVLLANVFLIGALCLLYRLVLLRFSDDATAQRTVLYVLLYPAGFFFSCFYTESAFLFFALAAFLAGERQRWLLAGAMGFLLALTRPHGAGIALPLALLYLQQRSWQLRALRPNVLALLLPPLGLGCFLVVSYVQTGNALLPVATQQAWGRGATMPWETVLQPRRWEPLISRLDQVAVLGALIGGILSWRMLRTPVYAAYVFVLCLPPLFTSVLDSNLRYSAVLFPLFLVLAHLGRRRLIDLSVTLIFAMLQALVFAAWTRYYWIV
jgi:uncharacterized membrane protein